ncbi:hypothetical protein B0H14DRAFT_2603899 [Mycena olivaceomarginata]|nr:hypothetical protein B0H14DRAFT_2603899 [Mycena olivaceomarginata]
MTASMVGLVNSGADLSEAIIFSGRNKMLEAETRAAQGSGGEESAGGITKWSVGISRKSYRSTQEMKGWNQNPEQSPRPSRKVIQIFSLTEPFLEVIKVDPRGIGEQLRVLGRKVNGGRLQNISWHQMEGQETWLIPKPLQNRVGEAHQKRFEFRHCVASRRRESTIAKRCVGFPGIVSDFLKTMSLAAKCVGFADLLAGFP